MSAFPKYPAYKDSGVEWLGEVPEHWEANRVFSIFNERVETGHSQLPILNITISNGVQVEQFEGERKKRLIEDRDAYKRAATGDIAYNTMRMWQGAVGDVPVDGLVSPAYVVARPIKSISSRYYSYLFRGETFQVETNRHSYGIVSDRNRLYWLGFKNIVVPIPPRTEQDRIVAFLDEKTAQIDALIAKKQRQIELLDEQKAILINRAVTRGIGNGELGMVNESGADADLGHSTFTIQNSQFKDSGIPWIGPIPKHWRVVPIKRMASVQNGVTLGPVYPVNMSSEVPYLRVANVQNGSLNLNVVATLRLPRRVAAKYLLQSGDVLVAEGGDLDKLGRGCVWRAELPYCIHQNHVFAVRTEAKRLLPEFLSTALGSRYGQRYFMLTGKQTTNLASTNSTSLMNFPLATPPLEEQELIMDELARTQTAFERARKAITSQIQTLQTLRSTLIAHAVTGKIKV